MVATQPMKMAAAEATYDTVCGADASFSIFTLGTPDGTNELFSIRVPYLLSLLSTHSLDGCVEGINDLQAQYTELWPRRLHPDHLGHLLGVPLDDRPRHGARPRRRRRPLAHPQGADAEAEVGVEGRHLELPALARRHDRRLGLHRDGPAAWIVFSQMFTESAVSPNVTGLDVLISLTAFTLIYGILAVVEVRLIIRAVKKGPPEIGAPDPETGRVEQPSTVY